MGGVAHETWKHLDAFGQDVGPKVGSALGDAWKHMDAFGQEAGKHVGGAAHGTFIQLDAFGQDVGPKIGPALEEAWKQADAFGQEAGKYASLAAQHTKQWIKEHPGETAGMIACVVAAPLGIGAAHSVLRMVGFTVKGIAAGTSRSSCLQRYPRD